MKKKIKRKYLAIFICILLVMFNFSIPAYAENMEPLYAGKGSIMTEEVFNSKYAVNSKNNLISENNLDEEAKIELYKISISEKYEIEIFARINYLNEWHTLNLNGNIFKSEKQDRGINSFAAVLEESKNNFDILLFEIYNDTKPDTLFVDITKNYNPHLKIYLKNSNNEIILFELDLPQIFQNVVTSDDMEKCQGLYDTLWFTQIVDPLEDAVLPMTDELMKKLGISPTISSRAVGTDTKWTMGTNYRSFNVGGDIYKMYSTLYGYWKATNVGSGDSTWTFSMNVSEYVEINGTKVNTDNGFNYRNLDIKAVCGANTTFHELKMDGRIAIKSGNLWKDAGKTVTGIISELLWSKIQDKIPTSGTVLSFLNLFGNSDYTKTATRTITLGGTSFQATEKGEAGISYRSPSQYLLYKDAGESDGHSFKFHPLVQGDTGLTGSTSVNRTTYGRFSAKWTVYFNNEVVRTDAAENSNGLNFSYQVKI